MKVPLTARRRDPGLLGNGIPGMGYLEWDAWDTWNRMNEMPGMLGPGPGLLVVPGVLEIWKYIGVLGYLGCS